MDGISKDSSYQKKAKEIAEDLLKNAQNSNMSKEDVVHSVAFYQAAKSVMKEYGCNAFRKFYQMIVAL